MHICIEFHTLNANTCIDWYPIPCIDDLLNWLHVACVFLKIELCAGYYYILLSQFV